MNRRTLAGTRSRVWTSASLAAASLAAATLISTAGRAQDAAPIQVEQPPLPSSPPPRYVLAAEDGPRVITRWHDGEPIPPGYHPTQRTRTGAIIGGAVTLGSLYLLNAFVAAVWTDAAKATHESNPVTGLFVPVLGPFITIPQSSSATADFFLILDGIGQTTGAILLVWGLTSPQTVLMRDGYAKPWILPRPMVFGKSGAGVGLTGTF
jgi:hypothetical protein